MTESLPIKPFREELQKILDTKCGGSKQNLAILLGISDTRVRHWFKEDTTTITIQRADEILSSLGIHLSEVYDYETYELV